MEDQRIVELYWDRDEQAIAETARKYGAYCTRISLNILENGQDAEECVNDTYLRAWETIPPSRPTRLGAFLARLVRNISLDRYRSLHTNRRGVSLFVESLDELEECVPHGDGWSTGFDDELEARRIGELLNRFLRKQPREAREVFVCRYFYSDSIGEISARFGLSESKVKSMLYRSRQKLRKLLESEGVQV